MRKLFTRYIAACISVAMLVATVFVPAFVAAEAVTVQPRLLISELQTGGLDAPGVENGKAEFVELYNPGNDPLDVTDWRVEYLSANHNGIGPPTRILVTLEGIVQPKSYVLVGYEGLIANADIFFGTGSTAASGLLARSGGHVRIVDVLDGTVDLVGWGTGVAIGSWPRLVEIPAGQSVQRILAEDTPVGSQGFAGPSLLTTPQSGGLTIPEPPEPEPSPEPTCDGLIISELLPNPDGVDSGKEYVELYNPTDQVLRLRGCSLRLGEAGETFYLPDEVLSPQAYRTFFDSETGLTLPNATAQTVWLLSANGEQSVTYPNELQSGQAWAIKDDTWQRTMTPTPGLANVLSEMSGDIAETPAARPQKPPVTCPAGKERNPDTNRCRNVAQLASNPAPCKSDTTRNPLTGRCRSVSAAVSLTPCKPGQQRSPQTNRCRSVLDQATAIKPCPSGQERNPQTNRCRKVQPNSNTMASIQDVRTNDSGFDARWVIAAVLVAGAIGYALYEWRQEFSLVIRKLMKRIRPGREGG